MPPKVKYGRDEIVDAAFRLVRREGAAACNARAVAGELGCSTQPLFRAFSSMDGLRQEVLNKANGVYAAYIQDSARLSPDTPYLGTGLAYLLFAREEPKLFQLLFMRDRGAEATVEKDPTLDYVLSLLMERSGYSHEQAKAFHMHMWVYVHGLAVMQATNFVSFEEAPLKNLKKMMSEQYRAMRLLYDSQANT